ncbi:MAG TPA: hypothetical protein VFA93_02995 [Patescibacteria group bacterium]|nr:hypothetical protein [Patescibacteria group bacterium]
MKKNNLLIAAVLIASLIQTTPVFAEGPKDLINDIQKFEKRATIAAQRQEQKIQKQNQKQQNNLSGAKKRADQAINRRISELNKLLQRIQNDQKLTSDDKANLSSDIQSAINGLTTLKSKIDADTDLTTLKSDAKQIVSGFKVFDVIVPKTRLLIIIDNLTSVTTKIAGFTPKIQDLINNLKSEGKDVTQLQSLLDNVNSRLTAINNQLSSDKTLVLGITASTTDPKSTFTQVRKDLAGVRKSLAQVRHDFAQMRDAFHLVITGGNSGNGASVSPTPSESPTPTPSSSPTATPTPTASPTI